MPGSLIVRHVCGRLLIWRTFCPCGRPATDVHVGPWHGDEADDMQQLRELGASVIINQNTFGIFCPETFTVTLADELPATYFCTRGSGHDGDHEAHGSNGRVLKVWPRA